MYETAGPPLVSPRPTRQRLYARSPAERRLSVPSPAAERRGDHLNKGLGLAQHSGHRRTPSRACHRAVNFPVGYVLL